MSGAGRRRRGTSSIAPSPTSSSSSSGRPEPRPRPSQLPQWKFSQVLGDLPHAAAGGRRDGTYQCKSQSVSNECSALELTEASSCACGSGRNLGHRVRRPRRVPGRRRPRRARHPLPEGRRGRGAASRRAGAHGPRRRAAAEVQLRDGVPEPRAGGEPPIDRELFVRSDQHTRVPLIPFPPPAGTRTQFDVLHSLEIGEKIKRVRWCARPNRSLCLLATNDRTVKLWKVSEHKAPPKEGDGEPRRSASTAGASLPLQEPRSERATTKPRGSSADSSDQIEKVGDVGDGYSAKCRRVFDRAHEFNINSISNNCDGETFVSADDLRINLWHLEVTSQCFNIVDMKPADMGDLR